MAADELRHSQVECLPTRTIEAVHQLEDGCREIRLGRPWDRGFSGPPLDHGAGDLLHRRDHRGRGHGLEPTYPALDIKNRLQLVAGLFSDPCDWHFAISVKEVERLGLVSFLAFTDLDVVYAGDGRGSELSSGVVKIRKRAISKLLASLLEVVPVSSGSVTVNWRLPPR